MKTDKNLILKYSHQLTSSLLYNLEKSTKKSMVLQSDIIDLNYYKNDINLKLSCNIIINDNHYRSSSISEFLPIYFEKLSIKNHKQNEIYFKNQYKFKYRNLTKAQIKYLAFSDQLIIKENLNQKLYGMEDKFVTLLGDKNMYNKDVIYGIIHYNVYKTLQSRIKKLLRKN